MMVRKKTYQFKFKIYHSKKSLKRNILWNHVRFVKKEDNVSWLILKFRDCQLRPVGSLQ